jgi:FAD dependent oxidoreductase TIGR03364
LKYDVAIVGAGVIGLAHAFEFAKRGLSVVVFEKQPVAQGASIRNFGMIWPIGQPLGDLYTLAQRSRESWLAVLQESGLWYSPCGSLHLAYHDDERAVLEEFTHSAKGGGIPVELLDPPEILGRFPAVNPKNLRGGLYSPVELTVDPRQVIRELPRWLNARYGVDFSFDNKVYDYEDSIVRTAHGKWQAQRLLIATGSDFRDLFPEHFQNTGLILCKLQMMRSQAYGSSFQLKTMLAGGLTLRHYKSFTICPSLPALVTRLDRDYGEYHRYGIHVMASQNGLGEIIIGDTHEYGAAIEPFDRPYLDELILKYLAGMVHIPDLQIQARWHGIYAKHPSEPFLDVPLQPNVRAVLGLGGAGMTLSFGLAQRIVPRWLGESL